MKSVKHPALIRPASASLFLILFTASNCQNSSAVFTDTSPTTSSVMISQTTTLRTSSLSILSQITSLETSSLPRTVDSSSNNPTQTSTIDTFGSSTVIVGSASQHQLYPISVGLSSASFDFTGFPPISQLVSGNAEFMEKYNFSTVPDLPIATPYQSRSSVDCTSINEKTCSWMCGGCTRPDDIVSCPGNNDWALTFDDGRYCQDLITLDLMILCLVSVTYFSLIF